MKCEISLAEDGTFNIPLREKLESKKTANENAVKGMFTGVDDLRLTSEELARLREIDGMVDNTSKGLLKDASAFYGTKVIRIKRFC